jgi:hypothetical protein
MNRCCRNASGNHKLKLVVTGKAKKPLLLYGTEADCIPVQYYNQRRAWMGREIFYNWFHKHCIPEVWAFLKGLPQKAVLLLDNVPSHPRDSVLTSDDGLIIVKFCPSISQLLYKQWTKE